ncbi:chemotaxis protein CheB [Stenotrophomonas sp. Iso1]|uniref:chemotaxis protein CheB n=1 Tax=Stenotrophomonas sp. Iso1 TaxID=2977283 RepID=UPI0022B7B194|nr:chemotaxis protein CheB [Stenotrophomonas sp. Iso1]
MYATDDSAKPVALLARAGAARDRLREAVAAAGGRIVLEEDPNALDAAAFDAAAPQVVLVALEPAVEDALERLEAVLEAPHLSLLFEEAELAARREGWEAQRWIRHLAAKLQGHHNVLPPGSESEQAEAAIAATAAPESAWQAPAPPRDAALNFELEEAAAVLGDWQPDAHPPAPVVQEARPEVLDFDQLIAAPATVATPAQETTTRSSAVPPPLPPLDATVVEPDTALPKAAGDFHSWSLLEDDGYTVEPVVVDVEKEQAPVLASLLNSEFSLVDIDAGADEVNGAVLLLAGIGGPDAVRRVLSGLPEDFQRPVLVQLRLDGGRYANLVKQMARATVLPVVLADPGQPLVAGNVYILPDEIGLELSGAGLSFSAEQNDLLSIMPPARSAVMMLSGADVALVPQVLEFADKGGWVAGQIGEGCYDPAAASQLAVAEMTAGDPEYLVAELAVHCAG